MKKGTMEKILSAEKTTFNIKGYIYDIVMDDFSGEVTLQSRGRGADASSFTSYNAYEYTHGGDVYRQAVDCAKEIEEELKKQRAEFSDV